MRFASAQFRNYELEAMLLVGKGGFCRLQFLGLTRKFFPQMRKRRIYGGG
jgi:hypothetical protein